MTLPLKKTDFIPVADYLAGEPLSDIRHEYIDGEVYAMAGESKAHNTVSGNVYMALRRHLRGSSCRAYMENVKVQVKQAHHESYYYPDIQVVCGEIAENPYYETAPVLIVEVLSPSTERYDRADKFHAYRQLDSLREYVLIAQDTPRVEVYRRAKQWEWELYTGEDAACYLDSVEMRLSLADVYEDVTLVEGN
jgi:Uma2 family endonuclease